MTLDKMTKQNYYNQNDQQNDYSQNGSIQNDSAK